MAVFFMEDNPVELLNGIVQSTSVLHSQELGRLNIVQEQVVEKMHRAAHEVLLMIQTTSDLPDHGEQISFELRQSLASVMGYAEYLLEQEGFNTLQVQRLQAIRANSKMLLIWLDELLMH
jgi:signal transduction histidine kinase